MVYLAVNINFRMAKLASSDTVVDPVVELFLQK